MTYPVIGITIGDLGGIGPEITVKSLSDTVRRLDYIPILIGAKSIFNHPYIQTLLNRSSRIKCIKEIKADFNKQDLISNHQSGIVYFLVTSTLTSFKVGAPSKENGRAAFDAISGAVKAIQSNQIDALVTAPICKESFQLAGISYTGHTTMLKDLTNTRNVSMAFYTSKLKTLLVTIHKPLKEVPQLLTGHLLSTSFDHSFLFARYLGLKNPRIAIAGLNPHAGENGLFGEEEIRIISPIISAFEKKGKKIHGPFPADTIYFRAVKGDFDIVISLYHDQGLIPVKLLAFDEAVNVTLGLPFIRTSPDHGTAFDIAYQGKASPRSMINAIELALQFNKSVIRTHA